MNKNYIKPELVITEIDATNIVATSIQMSSKAAQQDYVGGGDAKAFDFEDEEEEW